MPACLKGLAKRAVHEAGCRTQEGLLQRNKVTLIGEGSVEDVFGKERQGLRLTAEGGQIQFLFCSRVLIQPGMC